MPKRVLCIHHLVHKASRARKSGVEHGWVNRMNAAWYFVTLIFDLRHACTQQRDQGRSCLSYHLYGKYIVAFSGLLKFDVAHV